MLTLKVAKLFNFKYDPPPINLWEILIIKFLSIVDCNKILNLDLISQKKQNNDDSINKCNKIPDATFLQGPEGLEIGIRDNHSKHFLVTMVPHILS